MRIFSITESRFTTIKERIMYFSWMDIVLFISIFLSVASICLSLFFGWIIAYGDAQSHLNISKRIVDSITPGLAQLGGIWLPLPHLFMVPFVKIEILYRTGLAGSIVSGTAFVISCIYIFKLGYMLTKNAIAAFIAFFVFVTNPNMLYLQTTALTEPVLVCFFILSSYYFLRFLSVAVKNHHTELSKHEKQEEYITLILAALFGFCASLSRYDGWFLVAIEAMIIVLVYLPLSKYATLLREKKLKGVGEIIHHKFFLFGTPLYKKLRGMIVLFGVLAFIGIGMWFVWDGLILGDPLYFTDSPFSAKAQQQAWKTRHELPAYHNIGQAFQYYTFDTMTNVGAIIFVLFVIGLGVYLYKREQLFSYFFVLVFFAPYIFNILTLYMGQSVIFIPHITPANFEWHIFNVRYGILMLPAAALCIGLLFFYSRPQAKALIIFLFFIQFGLYASGYSKVLALTDGIQGLSASKTTNADIWMKKNYHGGLVLMDDFARSINIIQSNIPMQDIIYIGNKPYWPVSMQQPERYATWIVMQKNDDVWKNIYEKPEIQARLYKYFVKVYTSPDILIFERNGNIHS